MKKFLHNFDLKLQLTRYAAEERGAALMESIILFPVLLTLMMGGYDLGQGILLNQKTIAASQIIGDLIARNKSVTMATMTDMIRAGELAYEPYDTSDFGYDIVSVQFDVDGKPVVLWRVTENMDPNDDAVDSTEDLGEVGEGMIVVSTKFEYVPIFSHPVVGTMNMREVAFLRGRLSATVTCADCPS